MKKIPIVFVLVIGLLLLMGCTQTETETNGNLKEDNKEEIEIPTAEEKTVDNSFQGFMNWKEGMWADIRSIEGESTVMSIVEIKNNIIKFQTESIIENQESISQIWYDESSMKVIKFISKTDDMVICFDMIEEEQVELPKEDEAYLGKTPEMGYGLYTTPTNKKVNSAKFKAENGEYWVSNEVPFGIVKITDSQTDLISLYDFGTSGAINKISETDIANCQDLSSLISTN
ncbi:MAG: hypothetical protein WC356_01250 [Candidatus Micrarchaeia archaeon]